MTCIQTTNTGLTGYEAQMVKAELCRNLNEQHKQEMQNWYTVTHDHADAESESDNRPPILKFQTRLLTQCIYLKSEITLYQRLGAGVVQWIECWTCDCKVQAIVL